MAPSIRVRMKRRDDLFSSYKGYILKDDLYKILERINSSDIGDEFYGAIVIDYYENLVVGCRIRTELDEKNYYELYDMVRSVELSDSSN